MSSIRADAVAGQNEGGQRSHIEAVHRQGGGGLALTQVLRSFSFVCPFVCHGKEIMALFKVFCSRVSSLDTSGVALLLSFSNSPADGSGVLPPASQVLT